MTETMAAELKISKLDAARRQLETAVLLFFHEADPVSIHTLAAAAYNVLLDINTKIGGPDMMVKSFFKKCIKKEYQDDFRKLVTEAENFFKHANRDPERILRFNTFQTEVLLLDACLKYYGISQERIPILHTYKLWYMMKNPSHYFIPPELI